MAYSSISHIPVETVSFALSLRQDNSGEKDPFEGLTEEEREQLADQGKRKGGRGPCKNKSCVEEETQYKIQLVTKVQLSRKLSELQTEFGDIDEEVQEVTKRGDEVMADFAELESEYERNLPHKNKLELELRKLASERRKYTVNIGKLNKELEKLKRKAEKASQSYVSSKSTVSVQSMSEINIIPRDKMKGPKKHSGCLKFLPQEGRVVWSCCMMPDTDADGCLDDQSIGVRTTLILKRRDYYRPYSASVKIDPLLLQPWKRTAQPATPPVWPPTRRPMTTEDKTGRKITKMPELKDQMRFSSSLKSTNPHANSEKNFATAHQQQDALFEKMPALTLNSGAVYSKVRNRDGETPIGKVRKGHRKKMTGNFKPCNGVNKRLAMFEGMHIKNTSTGAMCSSLF